MAAASLFWLSVDADARQPKGSELISNREIFEKMELYQKINDKKFEMLIREMNRLREDMNRRFEQVDKRFEFIQQIILALLAVSLGTPVVIEVIRRRSDRKYERHKGQIKALIAVVRELAERDDDIRRVFQKQAWIYDELSGPVPG